MFPTGSQPAANAVLHCIGGRLFNAVSTADYMLSTVTGMTKGGSSAVLLDGLSAT